MIKLNCGGQLPNNVNTGDKFKAIDHYGTEITGVIDISKAHNKSRIFTLYLLQNVIDGGKGIDFIKHKKKYNFKFSYNLWDITCLIISPRFRSITIYPKQDSYEIY